MKAIKKPENILEIQYLCVVTTTFSHAGGNDEKEDRILAYTHAGGPTYILKKIQRHYLSNGDR
jgi:hypothetical protein